MGVFAELLMTCPACGGDVAFQSDNQGFGVFTPENAPDDVLTGVRGKVESCRGCGNSFWIHVRIGAFLSRHPQGE